MSDHERRELVSGEVETVAEGFVFTEGPVWFPPDGLVFSDIEGDTIYRADKSNYRKPSGKSNGLTVDPAGRLVACEHWNRRVSRTEIDGTVTVVADSFEGKQLNSPNDVIVRSDGTVFFTDPPGTILPLGGADVGYKGFALGLLVEAMTSGLGGYGRADGPTQWGESVFLQVIDAGAFGGRDRFVRETEWLAEACRISPARPGGPAVRLPGAQELALRAEQLKDGVKLHAGILPTLLPWAEKLGVAGPETTN